MVTRTFRVLYFQCKNVRCGASFAGSLELTHFISPSALDNPIVALPFRPTLRRRPGELPVANDNDLCGNDNDIGPGDNVSGSAPEAADQA